MRKVLKTAALTKFAAESRPRLLLSVSAHGVIPGLCHISALPRLDPNSSIGWIPALTLCGYTQRVPARLCAETHAQPQPEGNNECRMTTAPR